MVGAIQSSQRDFIIRTNLAQSSKECVTVPCEGDVSVFSRQRSSLNMADLAEPYGTGAKARLPPMKNIATVTIKRIWALRPNATKLPLFEIIIDSLLDFNNAQEIPLAP